MAEDNIEVVGTLRLPLGGLNGYMNVRGKQGRKKDKFQGCTPNKTRRTSLNQQQMRQILQSAHRFMSVCMSCACGVQLMLKEL